jgi:hypothetical protein
MSQPSKSAKSLLNRLTQDGVSTSKKQAPNAPPAPMHRLVALQRADGSWDLTNEVAAAIGFTLLRLEEGLAGAGGSRDEIRRAWATALALVWLREHAGHVHGEWRLLGAKAERYLTTVAATAPQGATWSDAAAAFLGRAQSTPGEASQPV